MGQKTGIGAIDRDAEARHGKPNSFANGCHNPSDRLSTAGPAQASVLIQSAAHTLTPKIVHQQITNFPIHRRSQMLLAIEKVDHLPW